MLSKGFGGGERYFVDLALALAEAGHEVQAVIHEKFKSAQLTITSHCTIGSHVHLRSGDWATIR